MTRKAPSQYAPASSGDIARLKSIPGPLDIRLVPAVVLTLLACLFVPQIPASWVAAVPWAVLMLAVLLTLVVWLSAREKLVLPRSLASAAGVLAVACWITLIAATQATGMRIQQQQSGWELAIVEGGPVRISGLTTAIATESVSSFGTQYFISVEVEAYGHPLSPLDHPAAVMVAGDQTWAEVPPDKEICFIASLDQGSGTVFARSATAPQDGPCTGNASPKASTTTTPVGPTVEHTGREKIRMALKDLSSSTLGTAPELLPGLIIGDRTAQTPELDTSMKAAGLSHLSAVSGANCSLVAGAITLVLRSMRIHRFVVFIATLGTLLVFVEIVGWEPSVIRAATMGAIGAWAVFSGRGRHALPVLCVAACVLMCWHPQIAQEAAFQLSLAATAGIVVLGRPLERWLARGLIRVFPEIIATMASSALAISVAAQIACQPVLLGITGSVNVYAIPANLLAAPLVPLITVPGTAAAFLGIVLPSVSQMILTIIAVPAAGIGWLATNVAQWPHALVAWPEGPVGVVLLLLYAFTAAILGMKILRWERRRRPLARRMSAARQPLHHPEETPATLFQRRAGWVIVLITLIAHGAALIPYFPGRLPDDWIIVGCTVGQGDMFLVRTGADSALVIDTGPEPYLARKCLNDVGIEQIDLLVITHLHADHMGGVSGVLAHTVPQHIIYSTAVAGSDDAVDLLPALAVPAQPGMRGMAGKPRPLHEDSEISTVWEVLAADQKTASENDASVQLFVEITVDGERLTGLFTGDMEEDATRRFLRGEKVPQRVDVLKIAHHGARNSGTEIIEQLRPRVSMIGVGIENTYGHPDPLIVETAEHHGLVLRTDLHGHVGLSLKRGSLLPSATG